MHCNNVSDHLAEDHLHFVEREGPQRLGADIAARADTQRKRGRGLIVRRLADRNELSVQYRSLTVTSLFFAISLKASARPTVSLTLRGGDQAGWVGKVDAAALLGLVLSHSMSPAAV